MVIVKDKSGREIKVNDFIGNNEKLLKQYGYTRIEQPPTAATPAKTETATAEKKSAKGATVAVVQIELPKK